jgi:hypothetical protein
MHLINVTVVAGYPVLRTSMALEDVGRWEATGTPNGLGCRDNDGGREGSKTGYDGGLSPEKSAVSHFLGH